MDKSIWRTRILCFALAATPVACGVNAPTEKVGQQASAATGGPHLMWWNIATGEEAAWLLSGSTVTGTQSLADRCGAINGCSIPEASGWQVIDTVGNSLLWFNWRLGNLVIKSFDDSGNTTSSKSLSSSCSAESGCATTWRPVGRMTFMPASCSSFRLCVDQPGLLWYNSTTTEIAAWLLGADGTTVTGVQSLGYRCDICSGEPIFTGDFNGDGTTDVLWRSGTSLTISLVKDASGTVMSNEALSGPPSTANFAGGADVNGDGNLDLLWFTPSDGTLQNELLDGQGNQVTPSPPVLSWTCDAASGCTRDWEPLGYVSFP
jgi:FG-GAP-like repeat